MTIAFVNAGAVGASGVGSPTAVAPSPVTNGNLLICVAGARGSVTLTAAGTAYTKKGQYQNSEQTLGLWYRYAATPESNLSITGGADSALSVITQWSGAVGSGDPFHVIGTLNANTAATISTNSITNTIDNVMVCHIGNSLDNNVWGNFAGAATGTAATGTTTSGTDDGFFVAYDVKTAAGTTGNGTAVETSVAPDNSISMMFSFLPLVVNSWDVTPGYGIQTQTNDAASVSFSGGDIPNGTVTPGYGNQTQSGIIASVNAGYNLTPSANIQTQSNNPAIVSYTAPSANVMPAIGSQTQSGNAASVNAGYNIVPVSNQQTQTGNAAVVSSGAPNASVTPGSNSQSQTNNIPDVFAAYVAAMLGGLQTQTQGIPSVSFQYPSYVLTPVSGTQSQSGNLTTVNAGYILTPIGGNQSQLSNAVMVSLSRQGTSTYIVKSGYRKTAYSEKKIISTENRSIRADKIDVVEYDYVNIRSKTRYNE